MEWTITKNDEKKVENKYIEKKGDRNYKKIKDKRWWKCFVLHNKKWFDGDGHKTQLETLTFTS
jgi:hypothetical protein